jgi:hypothetical protein
MPVLNQFSPPAKQNDFPNDPAKEEEFRSLWNSNVNGWTQQAIVGNPWNVEYGAHQTFYYNPLDTDMPDGATPVQISWIAFPNRIIYYFSSFTPDQQWEFADLGYLSDGTSIPQIPTSDAVCAGASTPTIPYGPYGPRGWQDEYCEWSVTRDPQTNKITRIDFTCENPEYWFTLWRVDPETVCELYRSTLNNQNVRVEDLYLYFNGSPVIDPTTGLPAYNPLNKWNSGTVSTSEAGGAMHLTSTPNNLATELALAGAATLLRQVGNGDAQTLLCCSQYGQPQRNSDPHIGQAANQVVQGNPQTGQVKISLADPVGLYIQMPDFSSYQLPSDPNLPPDAQPSDCWQIVRGQQSIDGFPSGSNFILHAAFEIPQSWIEAGVAFTVGDIMIQGNPIQWASQITQTFQVALYPLGIPTTDTQEPLPCIQSSNVQLAQPLQMMYANIWWAYFSTLVPNPRNFPMNLAGNTSTAAPLVPQGKTGVLMALTCRSATPGPTGQLPQVSFFIPGSETPDPNITATVYSLSNITYDVPGDSYPSADQVLMLQLDVGPNAQLGQRDVQVTNYDQNPATPGACFLVVTAGESA